MRDNIIAQSDLGGTNKNLYGRRKETKQRFETREQVVTPIATTERPAVCNRDLHSKLLTRETNYYSADLEQTHEMRFTYSVLTGQTTAATATSSRDIFSWRCAFLLLYLFFSFRRTIQCFCFEDVPFSCLSFALFLERFRSCFFFPLFGYTLTTRLLRNTSVALHLRLQSSSSSRQSSGLCVQCQLARRAVFHHPTFLSLSPRPPAPPKPKPKPGHTWG